MNTHLPVVVLTMGDPAGIGPEVALQAAASLEVLAVCRPVLVGDADWLRHIASVVIPDAIVETVRSPRLARPTQRQVACIDAGGANSETRQGVVSAAGGRAAFEAVKVATRLSMDGSADAICTAPLNKEALKLAGHDYPGHTELIAHLTGTAEVSMMLTAKGLRVIHCTTHVGLIEAIRSITPELVAATTQRGIRTLQKAGIVHPRVAVCGVNPHAGENGLFGEGEEDKQIRPGVDTLRARGFDVVGPLPADSAFFRAARGDFDLVVAMYHDQGHTPIKVLGIYSGVNITVGLPIIRTSVDHGTAFDIAGTGRADPRSMIGAVIEASRLAPSRERTG